MFLLFQICFHAPDKPQILKQLSVKTLDITNVCPYSKILLYLTLSKFWSTDIQTSRTHRSRSAQPEVFWKLYYPDILFEGQIYKLYRTKILDTCVLPLIFFECWFPCALHTTKIVEYEKKIFGLAWIRDIDSI